MLRRLRPVGACAAEPRHFYTELTRHIDRPQAVVSNPNIPKHGKGRAMTLAPNDTPLSNSDPNATDPTAGPNPSAPEAADPYAPATTSGESQSYAARMLSLFAGAETHHGTYDAAATTQNAKGKTEIKKTALNIPQAPTVDEWQRHLDGVRPLGISPVRDDSTSVWGVLDYDDYSGVSHVDLAAKVKSMGLRLVVCKSKSGGAHLFVFLSEPMSTPELRKCLAQMRRLLGLPSGTEVFPKQDRAKSEGVDYTNWLNMPYFNAEKGNRYAVNANGKGLSIRKFLDTAEKAKVAPADLLTLIAKTKDTLATAEAEPEEDVEDDVTLGWFEDWFATALTRIAKAVPGNADNTLMKVARDVGRFASVLDGLDLVAVQKQAQAAWDARGKPMEDFAGQWGRNISYGRKKGNPPRSHSLSNTRLETEFYAYMEMHQYFYVRGDRLWPPASIDGRFGKKDKMKASKWLDVNRAVDQVVWAPGMPKIIVGQQLEGVKWKEVAGTQVYNLYNAPDVVEGDPTAVKPWLDHIRRIYPEDMEHIVQWFAHRVQRPGEKINHALVLGGNQGIGKDTMLVPVFEAVGPMNHATVQPPEIFQGFNDYVKSVILLINEIHDLGDQNRYSFYQRTKPLAAAPPETHRLRELYRRPVTIFNVCGLIMSTNHKTDGLYLPEDDRRTYVAWSEATKEQFSDQYWNALYDWYYLENGLENVAAYLRCLDLHSFNAKAPPPKTAAWSEIVYANRAPEDADMYDALETLNRPDAVTVDQLRSAGSDDFREWLSQPRFRRQIPHRLDTAGYERIVNEGMKKGGDWKIGGRYQAVYVKKDLGSREKLTAATDLCARLTKEASARPAHLNQTP